MAVVIELPQKMETSWKLLSTTWTFYSRLRAGLLASGAEEFRLRMFGFQVLGEGVPSREDKPANRRSYSPENAEPSPEIWSEKRTRAAPPPLASVALTK